MANIKITVEGSLMDGHRITFKAPCHCSQAEKLEVLYIEDNTQKSKVFTMRDSQCKDLTGMDNLFAEGAYVDIVLDTTNSVAYLQNANTNAYLEKKLEIIRGTLTTGETEVVVTDARITEDSILSFYTSIYGVNPKEVTVSAGSVTLKFDAQESDMEVGVRVDG